MKARVEVPVKQPLKVIVDSHWRTPPGSAILAGPGEALVAGDESIPVPAGLPSSTVNCLPLPARDGRLDLQRLLTSLGAMEINEVQVEAGARLCGALLEAGLVDEWLVYQAPFLLGEGGPGPFAFGPLESMEQRTHLRVLETVRFNDDLRIRLQTTVRS
jgi:diaminohydroxyphosphoribosylaminopyrimidine deaminase/5-amino-6-(5-phosphoribosylamino)uracil reductase